jgi:SAM-dependent methyltransferase
MSNDPAKWAADYFDASGIEEWERLISTPLDEVSLYVHTHYLHKHVAPDARVLEIGAGAGRFTQVLANLRTSVVVGDISAVQLALNQRHGEQYGFEEAVEARHQLDICDMSVFADATFDVVVAYGGPLSYVLDQRDGALQECLRLLRPGGKLLLSVMSIWGTAHLYLDDVLSLPLAKNHHITRTGDLLPESSGDPGHFCHMFRVEELCEWLTASDLTLLDLSASNCLSLRWEALLDELRSDEEKWQELLRIELEACASDGCASMGTHIIAVAQR